MIPSLFFCANVHHAHCLSKVLRSHGIEVYPLWGGRHPQHGALSDQEKDRLQQAMRDGQIDGLASAGMFNEGADYPLAMGGFMCSPTLSGLLFRQRIGRLLRPYPAPQGPRDYQRDCLNAILRHARQGNMEQLVVAATGTGKTTIAAHGPKLVKYWKGENGARGRIMFLVHMDVLAQQSADTFARMNPHLRVGIEKADQRAGDADIVIGSIQTLGPPDKLGLPYNDRLRSFDPKQFDILNRDEAHRGAKSQYDDTVMRWFGALKEEPGCRDRELLVLGWTATPGRTDNIGLEKHYGVISYCYGIEQAIEEKYLTGIVAHRVETKIDVSKVKTGKISGEADFVIRDLETAINTPERNELVAQKYLEICRLEGMEGKFDPAGWRKPHAVIVDMVDVTSKHSLITTPVLFGLRSGFNPKGKDVLDQAKKVKALQQKHPTLDLTVEPHMEAIEATLQSIDLMKPPAVPVEISAASRYPWIGNPTGYFMGTRNGLLSVEQTALGQWEVYRSDQGIRTLIGTEKALKKALHSAEGLLSDKDRYMLRTDAKWRSRNDPPTPPQTTRVWQDDRKIREKYPTWAEFHAYCVRQFEAGNADYNKNGLSMRIDGLKAALR